MIRLKSMTLHADLSLDSGLMHLGEDFFYFLYRKMSGLNVPIHCDYYCDSIADLCNNDNLYYGLYVSPTQSIDISSP